MNEVFFVVAEFVRPRRWLQALTCAVLLVGCSQKSVTVQLHPLLANGDVSYVCRRTSDGAGVPLADCNSQAMYRGEEQLLALMTQTITGEVAVINVPLDPSALPGQWFVDIDPKTPGWGFLHVGAEPGDIATTPGGSATFVGVGELGRPGLYAIPTNCVGPPENGEPARDITSFPACALPAVPGEIQVAIEQPDADGQLFASCKHGELEDANPDPATTTVPGAKSDRVCRANLASESGPRGRRKLLVTLPDRGELVVIDAQSVIDSQLGAFPPCQIENTVPLAIDLPAGALQQQLPSDLTSTCAAASLPLPPLPSSLHAHPAGTALASDETLYIGDGAAPVIHRLDVSNPCSPQEEPPLIAQSYDNPGRIVTTSRVAVSPVGPLSNKRYVYAIDEFDWPSGSVMTFDVSEGSNNRLPLLRSGLSYIPGESADRIRPSGAPRDLGFVLRDRPHGDPALGDANDPRDQQTGLGTLCDPDPAHTADPTQYLGVQYRPVPPDFLTGARARELRGVFGTILLSSGQVDVVDIEDFDAPCRRPRWVNPSMTPDFRGCANDAVPFTTENERPALVQDVDSDTPTVSDEVSCNMVEPHRLRSAFMGLTDTTVGVHAPSLATLPQLTVPDAASAESPAQKPKLLAVDYPAVGDLPAANTQVFVGTVLYESVASGKSTPANPLELDPAKSETQYSVMLPYVEPRAYPSSDTLALVYEGRLSAELQSGILSHDGDQLLLDDTSLSFCDVGVNDRQRTEEALKGLLNRKPIDDNELTALAASYSDYVVITSDLPTNTDSYWSGAAQASDDAAGRGSCDYNTCLDIFGASDAKILSANREFTIETAEAQHMILSPRSPIEGVQLAQKADCCFPEGNRYVVRASKQWVLRGAATGFRHQLKTVQDTATGKFVCEHDCDPRKRFFESRVFELSQSSECTDAQGNSVSCLDVCVRNGDLLPPNDPATLGCIHDTPTSRFAVYRGDLTSVRDMQFVWTANGGFSSLRLDLTTVSSNVSPMHLVPLPNLDWLSVVDYGGLGLSMLSLDTLAPISPTLN